MFVAGPSAYPTEGGSPVGATPLKSEGPTPFYPPMCLKTHWDPTMILQRTLPNEYVPQALDPRPWTKICLEYTTAGDGGQPAPQVDQSVVLPTGGQFYPASRYSAAIDSESALRRLDQPLNKWCDKGKFEPNPRGDMYNSRLLVPTRMNADPNQIAEVAFPKVLMSAGPYECRKEMDMRNILLSDNLFMNATKQDRYKLKGKV